MNKTPCSAARALNQSRAEQCAMWSCSGQRQTLSCTELPIQTPTLRRSWGLILWFFFDGGLFGRCGFDGFLIVNLHRILQFIQAASCTDFSNKLSAGLQVMTASISSCFVSKRSHVAIFLRFNLMISPKTSLASFSLLILVFLCIIQTISRRVKNLHSVCALASSVAKCPLKFPEINCPVRSGILESKTSKSC